jgi:ABC-type bacteriocin/lantibiotic exporter with double-glycine peptidase domain
MSDGLTVPFALAAGLSGVAGCGIACVAMVANRTYESARRLFTQVAIDRVEEERGTSQKHLIRALKRAGKSARKVRFCGWRRITNVAIVPVNRSADSLWWHWVVFRGDRRRQYALDPTPTKTARRCDMRGMRRAASMLRFVESFMVAIPAVIL